MGVQLREKKMKNGQVSFYLDIYHNKTRWYEFLEIHINKTKQTEADKEKKRMAVEIRCKRETELLSDQNGLQDHTKRKADFIAWFADYLVERNLKCTNQNTTLLHLRRYMDGKALPFKAITPDWIKGFTKYLLNLVGVNSAKTYLKNMFTSLEIAVTDKIVQQNPFRLIPKRDKLKAKPIFRVSYTIEELQTLWVTSCPIEPEIRQAYFYSCFTGLRWSDVNPLRWSEIITKKIDGREEWFMYFEQEKTEDIEYLPISDQAVDILKDRKREQRATGTISLYVFPKVKETDIEKRTREKHVNYSIKKWAKAAGFDPKKMHFHNSRHTFATNVLESSPEADLWTVSKLLGHKSIDATQIYAHVRDSRKKAAVKGLPRLNMSQPAA